MDYKRKELLMMSISNNRRNSVDVNLLHVKKIKEKEESRRYSDDVKPNKTKKEKSARRFSLPRSPRISRKFHEYERITSEDENEE